MTFQDYLGLSVLLCIAGFSYVYIRRAKEDIL